jgi:hypothetical protein
VGAIDRLQKENIHLEPPRIMDRDAPKIDSFWDMNLAKV